MRGTADSLLAPVAVEPARLVESAIEAGREQVEQLLERVEEQLLAEAPEIEPLPDQIPGLEWIRDCRPERGS